MIFHFPIGTAVGVCSTDAYHEFFVANASAPLAQEQATSRLQLHWRLAPDGRPESHWVALNAKIPRA